MTTAKGGCKKHTSAFESACEAFGVRWPSKVGEKVKTWFYSPEMRLTQTTYELRSEIAASPLPMAIDDRDSSLSSTAHSDTFTPDQRSQTSSPLSSAPSSPVIENDNPFMNISELNPTGHEHLCRMLRRMKGLSIDPPRSKSSYKKKRRASTTGSTRAAKTDTRTAKRRATKNDFRPPAEAKRKPSGKSSVKRHDEQVSVGSRRHLLKISNLLQTRIHYPFQHEGYYADHGDYHALLDISQRIMQKTALQDKPLPQGEPRVWADSRQALCETILYYQAWQSACYISKGVLFSFMFDNNGSSRDLIDEDVIVARAGGGMMKDKLTSEMVQCRDQKENSQFHAVRNAIMLQSPIIIFCGSENTDIISRMPHRYCSLAWYKVTHAWCEQIRTKSGSAYEQIKYRFEKLCSDEPSWWMPSESANAPRVGNFDAPVVHKCLACKQVFQKIYLEGWMCLNPECRGFWRLPNLNSPRESDLHYDPRFLKQKTLWKSESSPYDMRPALPDPAQRMGEDVTFAMTRGMCCPRCGKCTSRVLWKGWICSACNFVHVPKHVLITSLSIRDPYHPVSKGHTQSTDSSDRHQVKAWVDFSHNYRIIHYTIKGIEGRITHMLANKTINEEPGGPDEMFEALQTEDINLERRRFAMGREEYMTAFSCNTGMPYKFVASVDTKPFEGSPWPLTTARTRLNWTARLALKDVISTDHDFNELLTIGYFNGQNIKYHDDGETGLGPTVASLSLGTPADMFFRVKAKHYTGVTKSGLLVETAPLPGTLHSAARRETLAELSKLSFSNQTVKNTWLLEAASEMGLTQQTQDRKPWIRLRLSHGDVVIMHGREIQEYLEHQVDSLGSLRFALTCRTILADHLKPEELPGYQVSPDQGAYDGSAIAEMRP